MISNVFRSCCAAAVSLLALGFASNAYASVVYDLDITTTPGTPASPAPYATVTLDTVTVDGVQGVEFTITSLADGYIPYTFYFNARDTIDPTKVLPLTLVNPDPTDVNFDFEGPGKFASKGFGKFDYLVDPYYQNNTKESSYSFIILETDGTSDCVNVDSTIDNYVFPSNGGNSGPQDFAGEIRTCTLTADVGGSTPEGGGSPVPEPASLSLIGLGASALLLRRKRSN